MGHMGRLYDVLCENTSQLSHEAWLDLRRPYIGSSDAAPALGMSPWTSQYSLWAEKSGSFQREDFDNERFWWGRALEPLVISRWSEQYEHPKPERNLMLRSRLHPFMAANPDGLLTDAVVEVKTADSWDEPRWDEGVPDHYAIQGAHLCIVSARNRCYFPVLFGGHRLREFVIDYEQSMLDSVVAGEREFWRRVTDNESPDPDGSESTMYTMREQFYNVQSGEAAELPAEVFTWIATYQQYSAVEDSAHAEAQRAKQKIMLQMRTAEIGTVNDETVVTWRADKNGKRSMRFPKRKAA